MSASIEVLSTYVPSLLVSRFSRDLFGSEGRGVARGEAAILFADISGFTSLTERLASMGTRGAEELSSALNAYFDRLIELIAAHGGDVVKMAGDALIALWPIEPGESLGQATLRVALCGLEVQEKLQNYEVAEGISLTSKIGIGAGEVVAMLVGGERDRWELLIAGSPLVQMGQAEHHAKPGEIVLSQEAWALIREDCAGDPLEDGLFRLRQARSIAPRPLAPSRPGPEDESAIRSLIPAAIRGRLDAGQTAWLAELRRLTVLFINLPLTDFERPDARDRAVRIVRVAQAALYRLEGSVNKLSVNEKGTTLVAALGLPPLAHRDDARRGLQAAILIRKGLEGIGVECSIGVATGRVYCGEIGNARRREYTTIGRVVNLAARLMQAANEHHEILCDEETTRATRGCFHFESLPPRRLKNIEGEVALFRPLDELAVCGEHRSTVGRERERASLNARLAGLLEGHGGVIVIEGEPGIGKSQLVGELVSRAEEAGIVALIGSGDSIERSAPYHAWRAVFESLLGEVDGLGPEARLVLVKGWLVDDPDLEPLSPLLNAILPMDLPENELTTHMAGQVRADNTNELLLRVLKRASKRRPTLLVLDDAHWMDSSSWALALLVARGVGNALLVVASRHEGSPFPDQYQTLFQLADDILRLGNLSNDDSLVLACERLGVNTLPREAGELILQKAQGNPLYCEELTYALRDAGLLMIENGRCQVKPGVNLASLGIPNSVEGIINSRVNRLAPSEQLALKVASVIGRLFMVRLLHNVYPIDEGRAGVPEHLDSLSRLELILPDEPEPERSYLFRHVITRDVVYNLLAFAHRRKLHEAVADWYERTLGGDLSPYYPLLAHHWSLAGDNVRAIGYLEKAGEQALRGGAYREATVFLERAIDLDTGGRIGCRPERVARWEYQLGEAYLSLGHLVKSREHVGRALSLLGRPIPSTGELPLGYLGQVASQVFRKLRPTSGSSEDGEVSRLASSAFGLLGQLCYFDQNKAIGVYAALRSLNEAESDEPSPELARALAVMCIACGLVPAHALAEVYRKRAFEVASKVNDLACRAWVLQLTGMYDLGIGRWDRARESLEEAIAINRRLGDWRRWEESSGELARLRFDLGDFEGSAALFAEFGEEARRRGHGQAHAWSLHGRTKALIRQGKLDEASTLLDESLALPPESFGIGDEILRGGLLARLHVLRREWPKAREAADLTSRLIGLSPPMVAYSLEGYAGPSEAYLALWELGEGPAPRREAWRSIFALWRIARVYPVGRPRAWLCRGTAQWLAGHPWRARRAWKKSLSTAEALGMPFDQAFALLEHSRHLDPGDPTRQDQLGRASDEILERLRVAHWLDQLGERVVP